MKPLELLFEGAELARFGLSASLAAPYGGDFGVDASHTYANFVSSLDGVVALGEGGESGHIISGDSEADRFVMALLRACADAVVIGAGTFRRTPGAFWHAAYVYPPLAEAFADLRKQLGLRVHPLLVLVTASGRLDTTQPAVQTALIATTRTGEEKLRGALPAGARVVAFDDHAIRLASLFELLRSEGLGRLLTEGGPTLVGELTKADLIDELFLTISPRLYGRSLGDGKKSLIHGVELEGRALALSSARRHGSHLFLRYALGKSLDSQRA
jgi:riboflavin biosynthesis pyrimidine reductase